MKKSSPRANILRTASSLFYKQGYSNTGINQIIEEAGVAKSTLYQQFRSKEHLLMEYLDETGAMTMEGLRRAADGQRGDGLAADGQGGNGKTGREAGPKERLFAIFDHLAELVTHDDYYGCHFLNIVYEMPGNEGRIRGRIRKQKDEVRALFAEILAPLGGEGLADEIYTLMEGALIGVKIHQDVWPICSAKRAIAKIL